MQCLPAQNGAAAGGERGGVLHHGIQVALPARLKVDDSSLPQGIAKAVQQHAAS